MQTTIVSVRYDAAKGCFDGRVDVQRDGMTFRYPCRVEAPESAPRDWIDDALARQALRMSQSDRAPVTEARPSLGGLLSDLMARLAHPLHARTPIPVRADDPRRPRARLY